MLYKLILAAAALMITPSAFADAWDGQQDPARFGGCKMSESLELLPLSGCPSVRAAAFVFARNFSRLDAEVIERMVAIPLRSGTIIFGLIDSYSTEIVALLEVSDSGWVIGGEYLGDDEAPQHPDFIWQPGGMTQPQGRVHREMRVRKIPAARLQALLQALTDAVDAGKCKSC